MTIARRVCGWAVLRRLGRSATTTVELALEVIQQERDAGDPARELEPAPLQRAPGEASQQHREQELAGYPDRGHRRGRRERRVLLDHCDLTRAPDVRVQKHLEDRHLDDEGLPGCDLAARSEEDRDGLPVAEVRERRRPRTSARRVDRWRHRVIDTLDERGAISKETQ